MKKQKVVIIGAGPAGLTAGYELLKKSKKYDVTILEATDEIGGLSRTIKYRGNRMDIGGHRFFTNNPDVANFWTSIIPLQGKAAYDDKKLKRKKELPKGGPDPEKENNVMLIRNRVSRICHSKKFFDYPISLTKETFQTLGWKKTMESGMSYVKSLISKKEENSLENFYINRYGKKLYETFFEGYSEKVWGKHPSEISYTCGLHKEQEQSILDIVKNKFHLPGKKENLKTEEFLYPKYGSGQLWELVKAEFEKLGGKIELKHPVTKINFKDNKIMSVICDDSGKEKVIKGDIFISSMPLKELITSMNGAVPRNIQKIASGLPYRDFVTIGLLVKKLNLRNESNIKTLGNIIPDCWMYVQEAEVKLGRIQIYNNWSPYIVKKSEETVWLGLEYYCNENDEFWNMSEKECVRFAVEELILMGIINEKDILDSHREKVKKAYPAYFDTYDQIDKLIKYLNKFDNLYCVGRNGQHRYSNMDHSMVTSFETVKNILSGTKKKDNIWNANTVQEHHEETEESDET